ncbi:hypothetical protein Z517_08451 [Fonsecaea pedrosoi CBS 271.37]|uniref:EthD domain-containing protein n=1 Tax=Fonsecaea pedrosoi CBS 271.37 TaxID=1442368 RepID=A0A0D2GD04_9EURO|nr:uncharacterized protein Z517_08451 [Fonsecaea pedrosoi CBS 271.37]KIW78613.1 hypothetical protein Z517_08451 [Fonsecaea pedrosoi CBS 271.37]
MPSPYLSFIESRPLPESGTDAATWEKFYTTEHLPDFVNSGLATRAAFYRETFDYASAPPPEKRPPRNYLALYETDLEELLKSKILAEGGVRAGSHLFPNKFDTFDNGEFHARNYRLVQDFDPKGWGNKPAPFIAVVEMDPTADAEADFDKWYREEHLPLLGELPLYRRGARYVLGPKTPTSTVDGAEPARYLAVHQCDSPRTWECPAGEAANSTPWALKHFTESNVFVARGWELVHAVDGGQGTS